MSSMRRIRTEKENLNHSPRCGGFGGNIDHRFAEQLASMLLPFQAGLSG
jgi:hypothetical protein